jgi:hypothetical protein
MSEKEFSGGCQAFQFWTSAIFSYAGIDETILQHMAIDRRLALLNPSRARAAEYTLEHP